MLTDPLAFFSYAPFLTSLPQRAWLYLQPIFASEDIQRQLPAEAKRFTGADKTWRATMQAARGGTTAVAVPVVAAPAGGAATAGPQPFPGTKALPLCSNAKLRDRFAEANKLLELVQKASRVCATTFILPSLTFSDRRWGKTVVGVHMYHPFHIQHIHQSR